MTYFYFVKYLYELTDSIHTVLRQASITFMYALLAVLHIVNISIADLFVNLDMSLGNVSV